MDAWIRRTGPADPDGPQQRPAQAGTPAGGPGPALRGEYGYAVAAIDAPGHGDRPRSAADEQARADLRRAMQAGEPVDEIVDAFIVPLVERAVPEWRATLDALLSLPEIGGPVGYSGSDRHRHSAGGGRAAHRGRRLLRRGLRAPRPCARRPGRSPFRCMFLLQWDDEGNDRQRALDLFDAFGTKEKTLHANLGGHAGTPWFEVEDGARFFARHLK